jgi:Uma2 family endonuclease
MVTTDQAKFTREHYMSLPEGFRAELLDGILVRDPAPASWHQVVVGKIHFQLVGLVGVARTVQSPVDVFVDDYNVLQPDILVLSADRSIRRGDREVGIPDLVIEVLSRSTEQRDRDQKVAIYLRAGVSEVWLVNPHTAAVEIHRTRGIEHYRPDDRPHSEVIPGFELDLATLLDT